MKKDTSPKNNVINSSIGSPYESAEKPFTESQAQDILAGLFEQLLLFDKITITTNRDNTALKFLISRLGIQMVENLFEKGYLQLLIWSPVILSSGGMQFRNGQIDEINGQLIGGSLSDEDLDVEKNINNAISHFNFNGEHRRAITRLVGDKYIVPNGLKMARDSTEILINAYKNNSLSSLGLPYEQEPDQLNKNQRIELFKLGHKLLETLVLSEYNLKSYDNYEHIEISKQFVNNIGKAYQVSDNAAYTFELKNLPSLKEIYLSEKLDFYNVFKLRQQSNAREYRKWINNIKENADATELTKEYINQLTSKRGFFETTGGKFLKTMTLFAADQGLGSSIQNKLTATVASLGLSFLETFYLDRFLEGKNPTMFMDNVKAEIYRQELINRGFIDR